jgi:hypothetical protein
MVESERRPAKTTAARGRQLNTWCEIAQYMGVSIRTAQMWADRGMPVRRIGGRVTAYTGELETWKLGPALTSVESAQQGWQLVRGALLAVGAIAALLLVVRAMPGDVASAARESGRQLVARDANGRFLWQHSFESPQHLASRVLAADLDDDGHNEVLAVDDSAVNRDATGNTLLVFDRRGQIRWSYACRRRVRDVKQEYSAVYFLTFELLPRPVPGNGARVVALSNHSYSYPQQVALLNERGDVKGEYWHSGHLTTFQADFSKAEPELLLGGVNDGYRQATLVVLDPRHVAGSSIVPPGDSHELVGLGKGEEKAVMLFPRPCFVEDVNRVTDIRVSTQGLRVTVAQGESADRSPTLIYEFDRSLKLRSMMASAAFSTQHRTLESAGKLDHALTDRELDGLKNVTALVPYRSK